MIIVPLLFIFDLATFRSIGPCVSLQGSPSLNRRLRDLVNGPFCAFKASTSGATQFAHPHKGFWRQISDVACIRSSL